MSSDNTSDKAATSFSVDVVTNLDNNVSRINNLLDVGINQSSERASELHDKLDMFKFEITEDELTTTTNNKKGEEVTKNKNINTIKTEKLTAIKEATGLAKETDEWKSYKYDGSDNYQETKKLFDNWKELSVKLTRVNECLERLNDYSEYCQDDKNTEENRTNFAKLKLKKFDKKDSKEHCYPGISTNPESFVKKVKTDKASIEKDMAALTKGNNDVHKYLKYMIEHYQIGENHIRIGNTTNIEVAIVVQWVLESVMMSSFNYVYNQVECGETEYITTTQVHLKDILDSLHSSDAYPLIANLPAIQQARDYLIAINNHKEASSAYTKALNAACKVYKDDYNKFKDSLMVQDDKNWLEDGGVRFKNTLNEYALHYYGADMTLPTEVPALQVETYGYDSSKNYNFSETTVLKKIKSRILYTYLQETKQNHPGPSQTKIESSAKKFILALGQNVCDYFSNGIRLMTKMITNNKTVNSNCVVALLASILNTTPESKSFKYVFDAIEERCNQYKSYSNDKQTFLSDFDNNRKSAQECRYKLITTIRFDHPVDWFNFAETKVKKEKAEKVVVAKKATTSATKKTTGSAKKTTGTVKKTTSAAKKTTGSAKKKSASTASSNESNESNESNDAELEDIMNASPEDDSSEVVEKPVKKMVKKKKTTTRRGDAN